jgi:hypothetical protein
MRETEGFLPQLFILHYSLFIIGFVAPTNTNLKHSPIADPPCYKSPPQCPLKELTERTAVSGLREYIDRFEGTFRKFYRLIE